MIWDTILQVVVVLLLLLLPFMGYRLFLRTKRKTSTGFLGGTAKSLGSMISPHHAYLKEMDSTITHEIRKTEPLDKDS